MSTTQHSFSVDLTGYDEKTITFDGSYSTKQLGTLINGQPYYALGGEIISKVIVIGDSFGSYDQIELTGSDLDNVRLYIQTSPDGNNWGDWVSLNDAEVANYVRIKIQFNSLIEEGTYKEFDFINRGEQERLPLNEYLDYVGGLMLKQKHLLGMAVSATDVGSLHRKKITRSEWLRIDRMNVL